MKTMIRLHYCFRGQVQGVGFRYKMYYLAQKYGVTGWVRNEYDGSVSAEVQGEEAAVDMILQALFSDRYIEIQDMETKKIPLYEGERGFLMEN